MTGDYTRCPFTYALFIGTAIVLTCLQTQEKKQVEKDKQMAKPKETIDTSTAAQTAGGPTFLVAVEQYEPQGKRIIDDPLAAKVLPLSYRLFVKPFRLSWLRNWTMNQFEKKIEGASSAFLCRKRYIDDRIVTAADNGTVSSVVNLGAGYDTRLYRLPALAALPSWEVDQSKNINSKRNGIRRALGEIPAHVTLVPINFMTENLGDVLKENGYLGDKQTFFIWEAVSQYLTESAVRETFNFLSTASTGSQLTFTYVPKDFIEGINFYGAKSFYERIVVKQNAWHFGFDPADVTDFLNEYGWRLVEDLSYGELNDRYAKPLGRDMPSMKIERMVWAEKG